MKNSLLKYYIVGFYLCSTLVMLADGLPGDDDSGGGLGDDGDTTPSGPDMPIDNYVWILALVALFFVFMKFRAMQNNKANTSK